MPTAKKSEENRWINELTHVIATFDAAQKELRRLSSDPFVALRQLDLVSDSLRTLGIQRLDSIEEIRKKIDTECLQLEVQFWGLLSDACNKAGWELFGNT